MTLTSATTAHVLQWRAFVGPPFVRSDAATFWDWSALDYDAVYEPAPADSALASDLATAATSAVLMSGVGWPTAGGFWVGPVGGYGGAWEYCTYTGKSTSTLTGLTRETVDSENTGSHLAQSQVIFWYPLTPIDGTLTLSDELDDSLSVLDWQTQLAGVNMPQVALRNGHLILIQTRHAVAGDADLGNWTNALVGWLQAPRVREDASTITSWQINVVSSGGLLQNIQALGLRVGPVNAAQGGGVSGTQEIAAWYKAAWTGEFIGSNVSLAPDQVVDDNAATLYASERYLGAENKPDPAFPYQHELYEVHISPYVGQGKGYRWFQFIVDGMGAYRFFNQLGYAIQVNGVSGSDVAVVCENAANFSSENPACNAPIIEVGSTATIGLGEVGDNELGSAGAYTVADWWDSLAPAAGALYYKGQSGGTERFHGGILWGTIDPDDVDAAWGGSYMDWSGANIAAPAAGQTIRRLFANGRNVAAGYAVDYVSNPGTFIGDGHRFYLLVNVNGMGLTLTDTITNSAPGATDTLYISLGSAPSVDGLDPDGTLQIGSEKITYSAKTAGNDGVVVTARGANGTTAAAHTAGETIYQIEDGMATDVLPLAGITLRRTSGKPYPKAFKIYGSRNIPSPRLPDEDEPSDPGEDVAWSQDYDLLDTVTNNSMAAYSYVHPAAYPPPTRRYRWLLLLVTAMTTDPYQLMLNEFEVAVANDVYSAATYLASGTVFAAAQAILRGCGIPDGAIVDGTGTPTVTDYTTAPDAALPVLADLADMTSCFISVERDSKITVSVHPHFGATLSASVAWTKSTAMSYALDWPWGRAISQVELPWLSLDGSTGGTVKYPTVPDAFGDVLTLDPQRYADAAAALVGAEKRYWLTRLPFGAVIEAAGAPWSARPGVAHGVTWQLDSTMLALARTYLLDSVTHRIADSSLATVLHGVQYGREDER